MAHGYGKEENVELAIELFGWETEKITDEKVLLFLADNDYLKQFQNFEQFVIDTNQTTIDLSTLKLKLKD